ncbi:NAD(P)-binding domain-containing protein [Microbulbifer thermotolerans]|uniref:NADPH-dependent F420 reductase n=2 Tax=Microbulbifer thermotolerans TaxID=252514 RepID=UPI00224B5BDA|nr:NAD(P)-binding domain-containing protein [Microbulbifer thermotolerans]MCX2781231.1 NAD(P)-binding domain-containing protein [Microbulbifer thermotolerans]MCX2783423.1 NAD(P)-binding domain-containing protein [Microbulbifer thermotolerans]
MPKLTRNSAVGAGRLQKVGLSPAEFGFSKRGAPRAGGYRMKIGVIGAATVGWTLAKKLAGKGHDVQIANSRGVESLVPRIVDADVPLQPVLLEEALSNDLVLLAVPWVKIREVLDRQLDWNGRIIIDATNIFTSYAPDFQVDDLGNDSGSEIIARLTPGARVVKAFNTLPIEKMFAPLPASGLKRVLFVAGNNEPAVKDVMNIVRDCGLDPVAIGSLAVAGRQMELHGALNGLELFSPSDDNKEMV